MSHVNTSTIGRMKKFIRNSFKKRKKGEILLKKEKRESSFRNSSKLLQIYTLATAPDLEAFKFDGTRLSPVSPVNVNICVEDVITEYFKAQCPSYSVSRPTCTIQCSDKDFQELWQNATDHITDLSRALNMNELETTGRLAQYIKDHRIWIKPTGWAGFIHKTQLTCFTGLSTMQTLRITAGSHMSGVTGVQLLQTATPLLITIPVVGGLFFGSLERVFHGTIFGGVCAVGRDAILVPVFIVETFYNDMLVGPVLGWFGIVAPLNFTSYLRFGEGIRAVDHPGVKAVVIDGLHKVGIFLKNLK